MKKLLFFISALAGLFLATSCEREEMAPASANAVVSYSIEVPAVTTRALGDNVENINDLVYAVYSTEATSLDEAKTATDLQLLYLKNFAEDDSKFSVVDGVNRATVDIELINNKNYVVLFWAQYDDTWISDNSFDLRNVGYPAEMFANDNNYAAFSGADFISSDNLSVKKNLKLKRAVAQINIGTKGADNFNVGLVSSSVIVKNAGKKFNVLTQTAQDVKDVEFKTANTISAEELSVNSIDYLYAAMNYVFANGNVEVDYTINYNLTNSNGEQINGSVNNSVPDVPVAQNYRTNIVGKLLTSTADYTIELEGFSTNSNSGNIEVVAEGIVKNQNDDYEISSENGMVYAMNNLFAEGGNFYVVKSLNMTGYEVEAPVIPNGTTFNFFVEIPIVTRAAEQITIEGLKYLIGKVESGATVSISGVTMSGNTTGAVIKEVVDGATVVVTDCSVNNSDELDNIIETGTGKDKVIDATNIDSLEELEKVLTTGIKEIPIGTASALKWIADLVNNGTNYFAGKTIVLDKDIDLNNQEWTPIGSAAKDHGFMGNFDGNGKTIKNLKITSITPDADNYAYAALFGVTEGTETERNYIKNLTIENVNISTEGQIVSAAVAYPYYTTIENITVKGNITIEGGNYTSGVLAYTRRCVNAKDLSIAGNAGSYIKGNQTVGGVISDIQMNGGLKANYSNFKAEGLTITATKNVGGISGIIGGQTLNGATVKDVNIVSDDVRKGKVAGALGEKSTITNIVVNNVTGATDVVGAAYSTPQDYEIIENNGEYTAELKYSVSEDGDTYTISSAAGLIWFADQVNVQKKAFNGKTVKLDADIDLANILWTPIGQTGATTFNGVFDGQNHTISNLNIDSESQTGEHYSSGLFGWVESHSAGHGHLKNIKIDGATVKGHHNCGVLVGYITQETALVENCHVTNATIVCTKANDDADGDKAGALIGNATVATPVKDCTASNSTVSAGRDAGQVIGAGKAANVTGCSATNVTVSANGTSTGANIKNEVIGRNL